MNFKFVFFAFGLSLLANLPVFADGLTRNGHIVSPYTVLTLTKEQVKALDNGAQQIQMSQTQRQAMSKLPHANLVSKLWVYPKNIHTCTCEKADAAIRADKTHIEVSHWLFARGYSENTLRDYWRQDFNQLEASTGPSGENVKFSKQLNEGIALRKTNLSKSIEIFEKILNKNKENKLLRRCLAQLYFEEGQTLLTKGNKSGAIQSFETSIAYAKDSWYQETHTLLANENLALARSNK